MEGWREVSGLGNCTWFAVLGGKRSSNKQETPEDKRWTDTLLAKNRGCHKAQKPTRSEMRCGLGSTQVGGNHGEHHDFLRNQARPMVLTETGILAPREHFWLSQLEAG